MSEPLLIVPIENIPQVDNVTDVPVDDLMAVYKTCLEMQDICDLESGIGLSAVQVGIPWRLFIIRENEKYNFYVNCKYEAVEDIIRGEEKVTTMEGCLSLKDEKGNLLSYNLARY